MITPLEERAGHPPPGGVMIVLVLLVAGTLSGGMGFRWEAMIPMLAATGLVILLHLRPNGTWPAPEGVLVGTVLGFLAMSFCLKVGKDETLIRYLREVTPELRVWQRRYTGYGITLRVLLAVAFVGTLAYLPGRDRWRRIASRLFWGLVAIAIMIRVLMLFSSPHPVIDVHISQTLGAKGLLLQCAPEEKRPPLLERMTGDGAERWALSQTRNVYAMRFPSPYFDPQRNGPRFDSEGNPREKAWFEHYGYPPLTVYANALSFLLFKEIRGLWVLCDLIGALCIYLLARRIRPDVAQRRYAELATLAFLFMPRTLFVLEQSWTEPLVVATMGLLALATASGRGPVLLGLILGLWLSSKQYVVVAVFGFLKFLRPAKRLLIASLIALIVGAGLILPMAFWNFEALWHDVFGFFLQSFARPDALSVIGLLARFNIQLPWWLVTVAWVGGIVFFTTCMRRSLAGWLFSAAGSWLFFFMMGKQAFMNYFYVMIFALILTVAATPAIPLTDPECVHRSNREL